MLWEWILRFLESKMSNPPLARPPLHGHNIDTELRTDISFNSQLKKRKIFDPKRLIVINQRQP